MCDRSGYTLIELLVVIALIAVLTAAVGIGLRGANDATALEAAGGVIASQLSAARGRAALAGRPAAVALAADANDDEQYLRVLAVAVQQTDGTWSAVDDGVRLAGNVQLSSPADGGTIWQGPVAVQLDSEGEPTPCFLITFTPTGALAGAGGGALWWKRGDSNDEATSRGLTVSRYGAITAIPVVATAETTTP